MQASARQKRADIDIKHPVMHHGPKHTAHSQAMEVPVRSPAATTDNHSKVGHQHYMFDCSCLQLVHLETCWSTLV